MCVLDLPGAVGARLIHAALGVRECALFVGDGLVGVSDAFADVEHLLAALDAGLVGLLRVFGEPLRLCALLGQVQPGPLVADAEPFQLVRGDARLLLCRLELFLGLLEAQDGLALVEVGFGKLLVHVLQGARRLSAGVVQFSLYGAGIALRVGEVPLGVGDLPLCVLDALGRIHAGLREGALRVGQPPLR